MATMSMFSVLLVIMIHCSSGQYWLKVEYTSQLLPLGDGFMAAGYDNQSQSIYLIGGKHYGEHSCAFNIAQQEFHYSSFSILTADTYGYGQFYTQLGDTLYMIDPSGISLSTFNLKTKIFDSNWKNIIIKTNVHDSGCIASSPAHIFIVGGGKMNTQTHFYVDTLQILTVSTLTWMENTPNMQQTRANHACVVHPNTNTLYAIGGDRDQNCKSIEKILITDIQHQVWNFNVNNLTMISCTGNQAFSYGDRIYILSSIAFSYGYRYKYHGLQILDVRSGAVYPGASPVYYLYGPGSILVNNKLYAFGCSNYGDGYSQWWQYYKISSTIPTYRSTINPTELPTESPTDISLSPSSGPTLYPTTIPTSYPTIIPSIQPTISPSAAPTIYPSADPTIYPSADPTINPSADPTIYPSPEPRFSNNTVEFSNSTEESHEKSHENRSKESTEDILIYIVIVSVSIMIAIIIVIICVLRIIKKRRFKEVYINLTTSVEEKGNEVQMNTLQSNTLNNTHYNSPQRPLNPTVNKTKINNNNDPLSSNNNRNVEEISDDQMILQEKQKEQDIYGGDIDDMEIPDVAHNADNH